MRLTMMTDYALRLMMYLGAAPADRLSTIAEIAQAYGVSEAHLTKITHQLARRGWIETVRGKGGGMRLAHPPAAISVGAVVRDMEADFALVACFGEAGRSCVLTPACGLAAVLAGGLDAFLSHLDRHTLADILPTTSAGQHRISIVK